MVVFLLQHVHVHTDGDESVKVVGIYSSREAALAAVERKVKYPGFSESPKLIEPLTDDEERGFTVDEITVDRDLWSEGFIAV